MMKNGFVKVSGMPFVTGAPPYGGVPPYMTNDHWPIPKLANGCKRDFMLAFPRNKKQQSFFLCDECNGQIRDYRKATVVILQDTLISKVKVIHKDCFSQDEGIALMRLNEFLIGLLK